MPLDEELGLWAGAIEDNIRGITTEYIKRIAARLAQIGALSASDVHKINRLAWSGHDLDEIAKELGKASWMTVEQIEKLYDAVGAGAYKDAKALYDYRGLARIPYLQHAGMRAYVRSCVAQTTRYIESTIGLSTIRRSNLSQSMGFMLRNPANPKQLMFTNLSDTYQRILDKAIHTQALGLVDYKKAMRQACNDLAGSGIQIVTWTSENGRVTRQRIEAAVRRNVLDGFSAVAQGIHDEVGRQVGADGKELSAHLNPAPDHEPIQGKQFTNDDWDRMQTNQPFVDSEGTAYPALKRIIGVWNCHHLGMPIILGVSRPLYSREELERMRKKNQDGFVDDSGSFGPVGRRYTLYEATQIQRAIERDVRTEKERQILARATGDDETARDAQRKINKLTTSYARLGKLTGLEVERDKYRMAVSGYHRIKA